MTDTETVRERLEGELEGGRIHGLVVTRRQSDTIYVVVVQSTTWDAIDDDVDLDIPVLDMRTAVVDLDKDTVRVSNNGIWVPRSTEIAGGLTQLLGRTTSDLNGAVGEGAGPLLKSAVDGLEADMLLERELEVREEVQDQYVSKMENTVGIDPSRPWGYGAGPPPEIDRVVELLEAAGLDPAEHVTRLVFGKKEPMDRKPRPVDELKGNYGIELLPRKSGLIAIDVDYPEHFPEAELPDTLEVSSPHGDDDRRHVILRCDDKERIAEEIGAWAVQSVPWGDLWIGDRYVVGPGSQLSEFGCDDGEHERGERGGCERCEDPDGGYYRIVNDVPIATVDADAILELVPEEILEAAELRNGRADNDPPEGAEPDEPTGPVCDNCGAVHDDEDALKQLVVAGDTRQICRGGCNGGE